MKTNDNQLDRQFWDDRWNNGETFWDLKSASPPLISFFETIKDKNKRILIPGCGNAYEVDYLMQNGFTQVTVVDISPKLIIQLLDRYQAYIGNGLTIICADFFDLNGMYDYIIEQTFFCALQPDLRIKYREKMYALLRENGILAGLLFGVDFPQGPPFGGSKQEYLDLFSSKFQEFKIEECKTSVKPRMGTELFFTALKDEISFI